MTTYETLKAAYEALYNEVAAIPSNEYVCHNLSARLGAAEMALTDYEIENKLGQFA